MTVRHVRAAVTAELLVRAASGDELAGDSGASGRSLRAGAATSDISVRAAPPPLTVPAVPAAAVGGVYTTLYLSYCIDTHAQSALLVLQRAKITAYLVSGNLSRLGGRAGDGNLITAGDPPPDTCPRYTSYK